MIDALSRLAGIEPTASTKQLDKIKNETRLRDSWRADVDKLHGIMEALRCEYAQHKRDCSALSRYEYIKSMIKLAVREQSALSNSIRGGVERSTQNTAVESASEKGLVGQASEFARLSAALQERARSDAAVDRIYAEMSREEAEQALKRLQRETLDLKRDYRVLRDSLATLQQRYEDSKRLNPLQRYVALKSFVKEAIAVELRTDATSTSIEEDATLVAPDEARD